MQFRGRDGWRSANMKGSALDTALPVEAFAALPLLIANSDGHVLFCNGAAKKFFGCRDCDDRPCWEITRFRTEEGGPFCRVDCPLPRLAHEQSVEPHRTVYVRGSGGDTMRVELLSFVLPRFRRDGSAVMHLVVPDLEPNPDDDPEPEEDAPSDLRQLTSRENDILRLLASGLSTAAVASKLYISKTTVRNHVQHILQKLHVHGRLEAILTYLGQSGAD